MGQKVNRHKVLLIDDDSTVKYSLEMCLDDVCEVTQMITVADGLSILKKCDFDLVFLDLVMPSESGLDAIEDIYKANSFSHIVMLSSTNDARAAAVAFQKGVFDYIVKPFSVKDIKDCVTRIKGSWW